LLAPNLFGEVLAPNLFGEVLASNLFGGVVAPNLFGEVLAPNLFSGVVASNLFGEVLGKPAQLPNEFGSTNHKANFALAFGEKDTAYSPILWKPYCFLAK